MVCVSRFGEDMDFLWLMVVAIGPMLLGGAIAYALMRRRRLSPSERQRQHDAVERAYRDEPPPGSAEEHSPR
jgi:hypothetical protein